MSVPPPVILTKNEFKSSTVHGIFQNVDYPDSSVLSAGYFQRNLKVDGVLNINNLTLNETISGDVVVVNTSGVAMKSYVNTKINELLGGQPNSFYDTLKELSDYVISDISGSTTLTNSIASKQDKLVDGYYLKTTDLSGYGFLTNANMTDFITTTELQAYNYITSSALAGYGFLTNANITDFITTTELQAYNYLTSSALAGYNYITSAALSSYARLGVDNVFSSNNTTFNGYVAIKTPQTATSADIAFAVSNSMTNINSINIGMNLGTGNYNPSIIEGDSGIFAGKNISGSYGTAVLNLSAHSNNKASVRIDGLGTVNISALTNNLSADTTNITGACVFTSLPTCSATSTSNNSQLITKTIADQSYATTASLGSYALSSSLSAYATTASLGSYALSSSLSAYATTASLGSYALTSALGSYATTASLGSYVLTSALSAYATKTYVDSGRVPVGTIMFFPSSSLPTNYAECAGQVLQRSDYPELFAIIGTTYGSGTASNFLLPDLRGQFIRCCNQTGLGRDINRVVGSLQTDQIQTHTHRIDVNRNLAYAAGGGRANDAPGKDDVYTGTTGAFDRTSAPLPAAGALTVNAGGETRPWNIALTAFIRMLP